MSGLFLPRSFRVPRAARRMLMPIIEIPEFPIVMDLDFDGDVAYPANWDIDPVEFFDPEFFREVLPELHEMD